VYDNIADGSNNYFILFLVWEAAKITVGQLPGTPMFLLTSYLQSIKHWCMKTSGDGPNNYFLVWEAAKITAGQLPVAQCCCLLISNYLQRITHWCMKTSE
jgi:hypothetical protein